MTQQLECWPCNPRVRGAKLTANKESFILFAMISIRGLTNLCNGNAKTSEKYFV
jgi:hypothetical protein